VWVPELEFSVDILARQALKDAQARKNKLQQAAIAAAATAAQPGKNSSVGEELSLVEQMENCLLRELAAGGRGLPDFRSVCGVLEEVFTQEIFWVQGYSREVLVDVRCAFLSSFTHFCRNFASTHHDKERCIAGVFSSMM
jgi:hypothetical protein